MNKSLLFSTGGLLMVVGSGVWIWI